jgi:hypothetical protein
MDNYPDDIRNYDNDPRSPFYNNEREDFINRKVDIIEFDEIIEALESSDIEYEEIFQILAEVYLARGTELNTSLYKLNDIIERAIRSYAEKDPDHNCVAW